MEMRLKYRVDRHMSIKGFTLVEMLIVLSVMCLCMIIFPIVQHHAQISFRYQMLTLKQILLQAQINAIQSHRDISVVFNQDGYQIDGSYTAWNKEMRCDAAQIDYLAQGSTTKAQTIHCYQNQNRHDLVIQLGSGQIDVR